MEPYVTLDNLDVKTASWLEHIRPYNVHAMQLNAAKSALLVIDMQVFFLAEHSPSFTCGGVAIIPKVKRLIEAFRQAKRPVIFSRHVHHPDDLDSGIMGWWWQGKCLEGSPESEVHPELAPLPGEKVVFKHRYSAFYNTDLETVLRCLKVEDLVITGRDDQHVLRIDCPRCLFPRLPGVLPGRWHRLDQRGDAARQPDEPGARVCPCDDERGNRRLSSEEGNYDRFVQNRICPKA